MARIIEDDVVQAIVNYLGTRPYAEVCRIMPVLMNLPSTEGSTPVRPAEPKLSPPTEVPTSTPTQAPTLPPTET